MIRNEVVSALLSANSRRGLFQPRHVRFGKTINARRHFGSGFSFVFLSKPILSFGFSRYNGLELVLISMGVNLAGGSYSREVVRFSMDCRVPQVRQFLEF